MSEYTDAVEAGLKGVDAASTGLCPGCEECRDQFASDMSMEEFDEAWQAGEVFDEGGFSACGCGICNSNMHGTRHVWHWLDKDNNIIHENDACTDCVLFMANGDEPEFWE